MKTKPKAFIQKEEISLSLKEIKNFQNQYQPQSLLFIYIDIKTIKYIKLLK